MPSALDRKSASPASARPAPFSLAAVVLVAVAALLAWGNSLSAPFEMDDHPSILENTSIRRLWPPGWLNPPAAIGETVGGRPVLNFTFALNHAVGGLDVRGYRLVNVLIHAGAALTLFGLVRRTSGGGNAFALVVALLWFLHPLQTESVTYVVQRAESLCGLFSLLTLYAFVRGAEACCSGALRAPKGDGPAVADRRYRWSSRAWQVASVAACLLGMGTKEVAVTVPVLVLFYDRTFVAGSFLAAWRARRGYYLVLASTWIVLLALVASTGGNRGGTSGLNADVDALAYWLTQFKAVTHYLVLSFRPQPLVFEYGTFWMTGFAEVLPYAVPVLMLGLASLVALWRRPALGFLGFWFFGILAPTSLVPGTIQMIVEHRMYLPLAAVIVLACAAVRAGIGALPRRASWLPGVVAAGAILALGAATFARNRVYRSELALWQDTAAKRPDNPRAHHNLGMALAKDGRADEAMAEFRRAVALQPNHAYAHFELAKADLLAGRWSAAATGFAAAVAADPRFVNARVNLGRVLVRLGRSGEAIGHYQQALADEPGAVDIRVELARLLAQEGRVADAEALLREALRPDAGTAEVWFALGNLLARQQRFVEAIGAYEAVLTREPAHHDARANLANSQLFTGRIAEAIANYEVVLQARPGDTRTQENLRLAREAISGR